MRGTFLGSRLSRLGDSDMQPKTNEGSGLSIDSRLHVGGVPDAFIASGAYAPPAGLRL